MSPQDEVDRITHAWHRERPDLDIEPLAVLSRITRLARHLDRTRAAAFRSAGIESWEFDVLAALRRAGEPYRMTPKALIKSTLVTSGTMTNRISGLVARGLVERADDNVDRRAVQITLTEHGLERVDVAFSTLLEAERVVLSSLSKQEQQQLATLLRTLTLGYVGAANDPDCPPEIVSEARLRSHSLTTRAQSTAQMARTEYAEGQ
ncbi:MarR family winged helix-turn-helix transcriptional regulator [Humidisolicoccus flavus]|uniref:MarR family winged helix-turn-helix transcriptional regulator n=1 Tax=Humidisolicoccus flavus TaxID=3111414 RepID=UPI003250D01C